MFKYTLNNMIKLISMERIVGLCRLTEDLFLNMETLRSPFPMLTVAEKIRKCDYRMEKPCRGTLGQCKLQISSIRRNNGMEKPCRGTLRQCEWESEG